MRWSPGEALPLLGKELIELSAQGRTYLLRCAYAALLFILFVMGFHRQFSGGAIGDMSVLGSGKRLLDLLVMWQFIGLYVFMPAMLAPAIPSERERGTLEVLLVSRMRPPELLAQKLLSRVLGIGAFMLLALPLAGIAYTLGGVTTTQLWAAVIALAAGALQVGAWSLYCGVIAQTSMAAISGSYVRGAAILGVVVPLTLVPLMLLQGVASSIFHGLGVDLVGTAYPFMIYVHASRGEPAWSLVLGAWPVLASAVLFFVLACKAMNAKGYRLSPQLARLMPEYRPSSRLDWRRLQRRIRLGFAQGSLPDDRPVAWRELNRVTWWLKGRLGRALAAVGTVGALALLVGVLSWMAGFGMKDQVGLTILLGATFVISIPVIAGHASALISGERARNTLAVLLSTPIEPSDLLEQKLAGVRRLGRIAFAVIAALTTLEAVLEAPMGYGRSALYLGASLVTAWLYIGCASWLALWVGMRFAGQVQAGVTILAILIAWIVVPRIVVGFANPSATSWMHWLWLLSPASMFVIDEYPDDTPDWLGTVVINSLLYLAVLWLLRRQCRAGAERLRALV